MIDVKGGDFLHRLRKNEKQQAYTFEKNRNHSGVEEFPEGAYGSPMRKSIQINIPDQSLRKK